MEMKEDMKIGEYVGEKRRIGEHDTRKVIWRNGSRQREREKEGKRSGRKK